VTASDAEGNDYSKVHYTPSVGYFNGSGHEFTREQDYISCPIEYDFYENNAVCVN